MSSTTPLTPTSFIVLGLLDRAGPSTPYALKQAIAMSLGNFWTLPHSQLYAEPQRLARAGFVTEDVEEGGRRRRTYAITEKGRAALRAWTADPAAALPELRDIALLKLFFGADPAPIAGEQARHYRTKLAEYREIHGNLSAYGGPGSEGPLRTLEAGLAVSEALVAFWEGLAGD